MGTDSGCKHPAEGIVPKVPGCIPGWGRCSHIVLAAGCNLYFADQHRKIHPEQEDRSYRSPADYADRLAGCAGWDQAGCIAAAAGSHLAAGKGFAEEDSPEEALRSLPVLENRIGWDIGCIGCTGRTCSIDASDAEIMRY